MTIHVLYRKALGNNDKYTQHIEPNHELQERLGWNPCTGVVVFDTDREERDQMREALAEEMDLDSPDQLKWVEVTPK